jgi:hypothetical protein
MRLAPGEFFEEPGVINDSNDSMKPYYGAHGAMGGSYPGGHASLATFRRKNEMRENRKQRGGSRG